LQFSHGSAGTGASPLDFAATPPPAAAHSVDGYDHKADSGGPNDRVRLKESSFNGM
jgi:hypothetical protein